MQEHKSQKGDIRLSASEDESEHNMFASVGNVQLTVSREKILVR